MIIYIKSWTQQIFENVIKMKKSKLVKKITFFKIFKKIKKI